MRKFFQDAKNFVVTHNFVSRHKFNISATIYFMIMYDGDNYVLAVQHTSFPHFSLWTGDYMSIVVDYNLTYIDLLSTFTSKNNVMLIAEIYTRF